jgi:hypothetical protein
MIKDFNGGDTNSIKGNSKYTTNPKKFLNTCIGSTPFKRPIKTPNNHDANIKYHAFNNVVDSNLSTGLKTSELKLNLILIGYPRLYINTYP